MTHNTRNNDGTRIHTTTRRFRNTMTQHIEQQQRRETNRDKSNQAAQRREGNRQEKKKKKGECGRRAQPADYDYVKHA